MGVTTVAVTHDQTEALTMSDRVAVLNEGRLVQVGTPEDLYRRPATVFVDTFLGEATLVPVRRGHVQGFDCSTGTSATGLAVLRPEDLEVSS